MNYKNTIAEILTEQTGLDKGIVEHALEVPPSADMGDLAFPCFPLAKVMRKAPPLIAQEMAQSFPAPEFIDRVEAAGGYLNFFFKRSAYAKDALTEITAAGEHWGGGQKGVGKTVLVEFSSPNIAKPFHIGHLFSTAVGNSVEKIYKHLGYQTVKINHLGDWGTQFGKLISAYKHWGNREVIEKDPINELLKIYVMTEDFVAQDVPEKLYYIAVPWYEQDTQLLEKFEIAGESSVCYRGWEIMIYELGEKRQ